MFVSFNLYGFSDTSDFKFKIPINVNQSYPIDVSKTLDGYIIAGTSQGIKNGNMILPYSYDFLVARVNNKGKILWQQTYGQKDVNEKLINIKSSNDNCFNFLSPYISSFNPLQ